MNSFPPIRLCFHLKYFKQPFEENLRNLRPPLWQTTINVKTQSFIILFAPVLRYNLIRPGRHEIPRAVSGANKKIKRAHQD